jgi:hypothetical protein
LIFQQVTNIPRRSVFPSKSGTTLALHKLS